MTTTELILKQKTNNRKEKVREKKTRGAVALLRIKRPLASSPAVSSLPVTIELRVGDGLTRAVPSPDAEPG